MSLFLIKTMSSITLTLSGTSSHLKSNYFPPIELDRNFTYVCGLINFQTYNSIPNVDIYNNKFYCGKLKKHLIEISMQNGVHTVDKLNEYFTDEFKKKDTLLKIEFNRQTDKFSLFCDKTIDFTPKNSIGSLLGFKRRKLAANESHVSDKEFEIVFFNDFANIQISEEQNSFHIEKNSDYVVKREEFKINNIINLPIGSYEIDDISKYLTKKLKPTGLSLEVNKNTLKCELQCSEEVDFRNSNSLGNLLGFREQILMRNQLHVSDKVVDILRVNALRIECDIVTGSYINNTPSHCLHTFYPTVSKGYKLIEIPAHVIYLPVTVSSISELSIKIVDQDNRLVNFRGERITVTVHIKKHI